MGISLEFEGLISKYSKFQGGKSGFKFGKNQIEIQIKTNEKPQKTSRNSRNFLPKPQIPKEI